MDDHNHPHHYHHHHHHHQQHQNLEFTTMSDLRHLMSAPARSLPAELFPNFTPSGHHYDPLSSFPRNSVQLMPSDILPLTNNTSISVATPSSSSAAATTASLGGFDCDTSGCCFPGEASTARWPRQETLTLLEIRSRLDSKFRLANQKGPLWDELSRYSPSFVFLLDSLLTINFNASSTK